VEDRIPGLQEAAESAYLARCLVGPGGIERDELALVPVVEVDRRDRWVKRDAEVVILARAEG
jgi:hypothetical protein